LLSTIHSYTMHGSPDRTALASHMLTVTARPLFETINRWIYTGYLDDTYKEVGRWVELETSERS